MNADGIVYLIDQIIDRNIKINSIVGFTNATIKDLRIKAALLRFADYALSDAGQQIRRELNVIDNPADVFYPYIEDDQTSPVRIVLSSIEHDNQSLYEDTLAFYNVPGRINAIRQITDMQAGLHWDIGKAALVIEGRAAKHYQDFPAYTLERARLLSNKFCFIDDSKDGIVRTFKTLSVSVYGDVFVGCSASYDHEDTDHIFNISEVKGDLMERVGNWCWQYPLTLEADKIKSARLSKTWKVANGIALSDWESQKLDAIAVFVDVLERHAKRLHTELPYLGHFEIQMAALNTLHLQMMDSHLAKADNITREVFRAMCHQVGYKIAPEDVCSPQRRLLMIDNLHELELRNLQRKNQYPSKPPH